MLRVRLDRSDAARSRSEDAGAAGGCQRHAGARKEAAGGSLLLSAGCRQSLNRRRPLLGPAKTIRGVIAALRAASLAAPTLALSRPIGLVVGLAAMAGDLGSSFIKRRLGRLSSSRASGLDQIPESLFPALACKGLLALTAADVALIVALFSFGEIVLSRLLFWIHLRAQQASGTN